MAFMEWAQRSTLRFWSLLGITLGGVLALLVFAPAAWLAKAVSSLSNEHVFLSEPVGTVWHGDAVLVLAAGVTREANLAQAKALPGRIRWQFAPTWLGLEGTISSDCCSIEPMQVRMTLGWGEVKGWAMIPALDWPLSILEGLGAPWNTMEPQGLLSLKTQGFQMQWNFKEVKAVGNLTIDVVNFASRLSAIEPVGSYQILLNSQTDATQGLSINLQTVTGALRIEGQGVYSQGRVRFDGRAYSAPGFERQLNNLLNVIGRREGDVSLLQLR